MIPLIGISMGLILVFNARYFVDLLFACLGKIGKTTTQKVLNSCSRYLSPLRKYCIPKISGWTKYAHLDVDEADYNLASEIVDSTEFLMYVNNKLLGKFAKFF